MRILSSSFCLASNMPMFFTFCIRVLVLAKDDGEGLVIVQADAVLTLITSLEVLEIIEGAHWEGNLPEYCLLHFLLCSPWGCVWVPRAGMRGGDSEGLSPESSESRTVPEFPATQGHRGKRAGAVGFARGLFRWSGLIRPTCPQATPCLGFSLIHATRPARAYHKAVCESLGVRVPHMLWDKLLSNETHQPETMLKIKYSHRRGPKVERLTLLFEVSLQSLAALLSLLYALFM